MSMQRPATACESPEVRLSIDFTNPGTVDHVVAELEQNLKTLHSQRQNLEDLYHEERAQFEATHGDMVHRINIIEAGLQRYTEAMQGTSDPKIR